MQGLEESLDEEDLQAARLKACSRSEPPGGPDDTGSPGGFFTGKRFFQGLPLAVAQEGVNSSAQAAGHRPDNPGQVPIKCQKRPQ